MLVNHISSQLDTTSIKDLEKNELIRLKSRRSGQSIVCVKGMVWITQLGDSGDRILNAGEQFHTTLPGLLLLEALSDAQIKVCPERKAGIELPWPHPKTVNHGLVTP
ncbi:MAG: DUF2917 domain-containing protein [Desulfobacteraceae bacterium]|nr:DUF2917 domain-containing protein [Desulfobacteraceae bacterium]